MLAHLKKCHKVPDEAAKGVFKSNFSNAQIKSAFVPGGFRNVLRPKVGFLELTDMKFPIVCRHYHPFVMVFQLLLSTLTAGLNLPLAVLNFQFSNPKSGLLEIKFVLP